MLFLRLYTVLVQGEVTSVVSSDPCLAVSSSHQAGKYITVEITLELSQSI